MKTRMTELFGVKHPIVMAGMGRVTEPKLVAAVCNAGGLGIQALVTHTPEEARKVIREIKELTDKPFAINQTLSRPRAMEKIDVAIEEKVPIINYALGRPSFVDRVHEYGGKVIGTVAIARHAIRAEQFGADAIIVTGHEAAGHAHYATSMVMVPIVASMVKVPIISAGGYFDGRGLVAALALGADAISMGTRFIMTKESLVHEHWKQFILKASEQDTIYQDLGDPAINHRVLKTKKAEEEMSSKLPIIGALAGAIETKRMLNLSWLGLMRSGLSMRKGEEGLSMLGQMQVAASIAKGRKVMFEGDENAGTMTAGQCIGGINDVPTVAELIERIVAEAEKAAKVVQQKANA